MGTFLVGIEYPVTMEFPFEAPAFFRCDACGQRITHFRSDERDSAAFIEFHMARCPKRATSPKGGSE